MLHSRTAALLFPALLLLLLPWGVRGQGAADPETPSSPSSASPQRSPLPRWLRVNGELRGRYELLEGQFRRGGEGGDALLVFRTLLLAELGPGIARGRGVSVGAELQDSRSYLGTEGTPLSPSIVNPSDLLQLYARFQGGGGGGAPAADLILGRQTISVGSRRQVERVEFANVIRSFTGGHLFLTDGGSREGNLYLVVPLAGEPTDRTLLASNAHRADREQWNRRLWGIHLREGELLPGSIPGLSLELFLQGLHEGGSARFPTPHRWYLTPGFWLFRTPAPGRWDLDLEGALRFGSRRGSTAPEDTRELSVRASLLAAHLGHTLPVAGSPRLAGQLHWASGDRDPGDDRFDRYERLFGSRRSDLGHTGIHGPLTPANLRAVGGRVELAPTRWSDLRLGYLHASLASATDAWIVPGLQDPTGSSGTFIGHTLDARGRLWLAPGLLRMEVGGAALLFGDFPKRVPGGPVGDRTLFGYGQLLVVF